VEIVGTIIAKSWGEAYMNTKKKNTGTQDDSLQAYFSQIKDKTLLSFEEEKELSKRIQQGDEAACRKLIESNLRLVVKIAKSFMSGDVALMDLVQEGNIGLLKAAGKYDHRKNVRFSTYASWWIKQSITRALSNKRRSIRLPHRKEDSLRKIQKTYNSLSQILMRKPSVEEISKDVGMKKQDVLEIMNFSSSMVSLDSEINQDSGTLHDVFEDYTYSPDEELFEKVMHEDTMKFLAKLLEKERKILLYRFAFYGGRKYTLKKISNEMGISPETVRQIEMRAIKKLKEQAGDLRSYIFN
jgi:RNA polymerase primary sigma factor